MKKIFSAFLLMTMMVFSVGSFVSCSDIEKEIAALDTQATQNAEAISGLTSELTALKAALNAAQSDADAAMAAAEAAAAEAKAAKAAGDAAAAAAATAKAEAEAAKAAAAQAKAEAIAAATEKIEALQAAISQNVEAIQNLSGAVGANAVEIEALQGEVKKLQTEAANLVYAITNLNGTVESHTAKIEDLEIELSTLKASLENYKKNLEDLGLLNEELAEAVSYNLEAITNLQGTLDAQAMAIEDVQAALAEAVASVETLQASLTAIYNIVSVLATQIQSVVFVPEYSDADVVAQRYEVTTGKFTNFIVTATYEVRPAHLASSIASENVSFASVELKTKAAAAPEYFAAEVVSADDNTGRIVVRALIGDTDGASKTDCDYDKLAATNGKLALSLNIASIDVTELLIAKEEVSTVDMISSEYVTVEATTSPLKVGFYNSDSKKTETTYAPAKNVEVSWNTPVANSVKSLFEVPVTVEVCGKNLSLAEANALLGTTLTLDYGTSKTNFAATYYYKGTEIDTEEETAPIKVEGKTLAATAQLVASDDYKNEASVGAYATVEGEVYVKNGKTAVVTLEAERTYEIVNKKADFSFSDVKKLAWSYEDGDKARAISAELDVIGFEGINTSDVTFDSEFVATWKEGKTTKTAKAKVVALSSKVVKVTIDGGQLPYAQDKDAVYTFKGNAESKNVDYTVAFDVTLGGMPADQTIDLGTYTITGDVRFGSEVPVSPVAKAFDLIKVYDDKLTMKALTENKSTYIKYVGSDDDEYTLNGEANTQIALVPNPKQNAKDAKVYEDKSYISIPALAKYENTITVTQTYDVCGVTYTYTATVKTEAPTLKIATNDVFVKDGVATVDGTVKLPVTKSKTSEVTGTSIPYALSAIDLRNYVHVEFPADMKEEGYQLRYTLVTPLVNDKKEPLYNKDQVAPEFEAYTVVDSKRKVEGLNLLDWNLDINELEFEIALVAYDEKHADPKKDIVVDAVNVKLQVPTLVTFAADETVNAKYVNGVPATANVVEALSIVDKFGNNVYNPYATTLNDVFKGYSATLYNGKVQDVTLASDNFFNVYDMKVAAAEQEDLKVYLNNTEIAQSQVKFTYNQTTGAITLSEENANITGDIKFEVPVTLTYMYDNYGKAAQKVTAVVVFSQNAEAGEGTEVSFPNPSGAQWAFEMSMNAETLVNEDGEPIDEEGKVIKEEDFESFSAYMDALVTVPVKSNCVLDLTADYFTVAAEMYGSYIPVLYFTAAYKVVPTDATSGAIVLFELDEDGVTTDTVLAELPYTNFDGTTCTFDLTEANVLDITTETGVTTATVVPADEVITIGGAGWGPII